MEGPVCRMEQHPEAPPMAPSSVVASPEVVVGGWTQPSRMAQVPLTAAVVVLAEGGQMQQLDA